MKELLALPLIQVCFTSIKECGDVMGTFVGHDHNNDYAKLKCIRRCYWLGVILVEIRCTIISLTVPV